MTSDKLAPKIRFKGFSDPWEQRKARELFISVSEKGHPEYQVLSVTQNAGVVYRKDLDIDIKYKKKSLTNYKVIHPGNFVISLRSFQGGFEVSDKLGISSPAYTIFKFKKPSENDVGFWSFLFKGHNFIESLKTITFGIRDGKSISFNEFASLKLMYPISEEEQNKISNILESISQLIAANEDKLNQLKQLKKLMMQKIFSQEWRFKGFTDPWEQRKLENISNINPKQPLPEYFLYVDLESVEGGNIKKYQTQNKNSAPSRAQRVANSGDIFFQNVRPYQKNNVIFEQSLNNDPVVFSTGYTQIRTQENSNFIITQMQMNNFVNRVLARSTGTSYPAITSKELSEMQISLPIFEEQKKVGTLFKILSDLIAANEEKLEQLKQLKKYLMQNMFA